MVRMETMKVYGLVTMEQTETIASKSRDPIFPLHSRVKEWLSRATFFCDLQACTVGSQV